MRKTILAGISALALVVSAGVASANGNNSNFSVSESFSIGASGSALSKGGTSGGTYAKGKNGSDAYSFSENYVTNTGQVNVGLGQSVDTRTSTGWGKSVAKTSGVGAIAEAFSERNTFGKSKTSFYGNYSTTTQINGTWSIPGLFW